MKYPTLILVCLICLLVACNNNPKSYVTKTHFINKTTGQIDEECVQYYHDGSDGTYIKVVFNNSKYVVILTSFKTEDGVSVKSWLKNRKSN